MELVDELTQKLGINQQQASGGLGLIMRLAKSKLGGDFGQVAQHVPGVDNLINSAPQAPAAGGAGAGGIMGALGGLLGGKAGGMGALGSLAGGFQQLGLAPGMMGNFVSVVLNYLQSHGGAPAKGTLERALA